MSHLRISTDAVLSPQIPKGKAHMVVAVEPTEALRVLSNYGNIDTKVISNTRPVYSVGVISGESKYPDIDNIKEWMEKLTKSYWLIDATAEALKLGNPILSNVILIGALAAVGDIPLDSKGFQKVISRSMSHDKTKINLIAFGIGMASIL